MTIEFDHFKMAFGFGDVIATLKLLVDSLRKRSSGKRDKALAAAKFYRELADCISGIAVAFQERRRPTALCAQLARHAENIEDVLKYLNVDADSIYWFKKHALYTAQEFPDSSKTFFELFGISRPYEINYVTIEKANTSWGSPTALQRADGERLLDTAVEELNTLAGQIRAMAVEMEALA